MKKKMQNKNKIILMSIFIIILVGSIIPQSYALYSIPPTPAIKRITTLNSTVYAKNYTANFNFKGLNGIHIYGSNSSKTIYFNGTISNGTTFTPITCTLNSQLHSINSGGIFTCAINNNTGNTPIKYLLCLNEIYCPSNSTNLINGNGLLTNIGTFNLPLSIIRQVGNITITNTTSIMKTLTVGTIPQHLVYDPLTHSIYVSNNGNTALSVINNTNKISRTINGFNAPLGNAFNPNNGLIYVANNDLGTNTVSVLNGTHIIATISGAGNSLYGITFNSYNGNMYVTSTGNDTVSVINGTNKIIKTITGFAGPQNLAFNPNNNEVYVANADNGIRIIDTNNKIIKTIIAASEPDDLAFNAFDGNMYVTVPSSNQILVINSTNQIIKTITSITTPLGLAFNSYNGNMYVVGNSKLYVIGKDYSILRTITLGSLPIYITFNPNTGYMYVSDQTDNTVSIISDTIQIGIGTNVLITGSNIGHGGKGFFKNTSSNTFNLRNLTSTRTDLITISQNLTDVRLNSTFKAPNKNCGASNFLQVWVNTTGFTCANGNLGTITTATNIGHGGKGFFKDVTGSSINLRNITSTRTDLITISQNVTDVIVSSTFKSLTTNCSAGQFFNTYSNSTGIFGCTASSFTDTNTAQVTNIGTANGLGLQAARTNATNNNIRSITCTSPILCSNNATNTRINSTAITSINQQNGPNISIIRGSSNDTLVTNSSNTIKITLKPNVILGNGSAQRVDKPITIQDPEINGIKLSLVTKTTPYTMNQYDVYVNANATAGGTPITLPTAASPNVNNTFIIHKVDFGTTKLVIKPQGGQSIDGLTTMNITNAKDNLCLISNGTAWHNTCFPNNIEFPRGTHQINPWLNIPYIQTNNATFTPVANTLYATKLDLLSFIKTDQIRIGVTTAGASSLCRIGIYSSNSTAYPNILIINSDVGTLTTSTLGIKTNTFTSPIILAPGTYWLVLNCQATVPLLAGIGASALTTFGGQTDHIGVLFGYVGWQVSSTFGSLPSTFPNGATGMRNVQVPLIQIRPIG